MKRRFRLKKYAWGDLVNTTTSANYIDSRSSTQKDQEGKDNQIEQTGVGVANAIGPMWGALAQVGLGASKSIKGDGSSESNDIKSQFVNPFSPFVGNKSAGDWANSFLNPIGSNIAKGKKQHQDYLDNLQRKYNGISAQIEHNSQSILAAYPSYGVPQAKYGRKLPLYNTNWLTKVDGPTRYDNSPFFMNGGNVNPLFGNRRVNPKFANGYYANGGNLPMPTDDSDATQLASNMAVYNGATHENGGIDLDTNQDGKQDIELENNEVIKDDMVLSDRLKPSNNIKAIAKELGIRLQENDSYASLAERLGKKKGDWEKKLNSTLIGEHTAAQKMIQKYEEFGNHLFQDQQNQKEILGINEGNEKRPFGGPIPVGSDATRFALRIPINTPEISKGQGVMLRKRFDNDYKPTLTDSYNATSYMMDQYQNAQTKKRQEEEYNSYINSDPLLRLSNKLTFANGGTITIPEHEKRVNRNNLGIMAEKPYDNLTDNPQHGVNIYKYGGIHIKPSHRGRFTAYLKRTGSTLSAALHSPNAHVRQMANFARNARKWHHRAFGGYTGTDEPQYSNLYEGQNHSFHPNGGNSVMYANGGKYNFRSMYDIGGLLDENPNAIKLDSTSNPNMNWNTSSNVPSYFSNYPSYKVDNQGEAAPMGENLPIGSKGKRNIDWGNLATIGSQVAGTLVNQGAINKMETNLTPILSPTPTLNYTDRTNYLTNKIGSSYRAATQGLNRSYGSSDTGLASNMYAKSLESLNDALGNEQARKDNIFSNYNQIATYNNMYNSQAANHLNQVSMENRNQKRALTAENFSNLIHSNLRQREENDAKDLDMAKAYMGYVGYGANGVGDRYNSKFSPKFRKKYLDKYFNN